MWDFHFGSEVIGETRSSWWVGIKGLSEVWSGGCGNLNSIDRMSPTPHHLVFSSSDFTDTTIDCETLGLHYEVSTTKLPSSGIINRKKLVTFTKSIADIQNVTVGEW